MLDLQLIKGKKHVASPSQGHMEINKTDRQSFTHTPSYNIPVTCMFLVGVRKIEYPKRSDKCTRRSSTLRAVRT